MKGAHVLSASCGSVEPPKVDCIGLALDLEAQARRVESQTVERTMLAGAHGLRQLAATPSASVQHAWRDALQDARYFVDLHAQRNKPLKYNGVMQDPSGVNASLKRIDALLATAQSPVAPVAQPVADLARRLQSFRHRHWTHWSDEENQLVVDAFHALNRAHPSPAANGAAERLDTFRGDDAALIRSAQALLDLDADNALSPHGIGGHARGIISAFVARSAALASTEKQESPQ